uniref:Short salivary D7 protein n=1 Tax=Aedes aegypti TaxID=7159 RepID=Q1HRR6_AEDAE|nr:short salivary D7 protein [Aedes aegypti]
MCSIWLTFFLSFLILNTKAEQVYQTCADESFEPNDYWKQKMLCMAYRFNFYGYKSNSMYAFMDCTFIRVGWMDKGTRKWNVAKMAADMRASGFPDRTAELTEIEAWCNMEFRNKLGPMSYYRCIETSKQGPGEFKQMLRNREVEFFSKNQCQGVALD